MPRRLLLSIFCTILSAWLIILIGGYLWARAIEGSSLPPNLGNSDRNVASLKELEGRGPLIFGVVGDPHNSAAFDDLVGQMKKEGVDFLVVLGDVVHECSIENHHFFWNVISRLNLGFPVFLVMGDDDVGDAGHDEVDIHTFEHWYGPCNFSFYAKDCLFILLNNVYDSVESYVGFLERSLSERKPSTRYTFVFAHLPPFFSLPEAPPQILEDSQRFFDLCEKNGVDYFFSGHEHGYWRGRRNGVEYIKVAGGGGRLPRKRGAGMFHHAMLFHVDDGLAVENLVVSRYSDLELKLSRKRLRLFFCIYAYPFWKKHMILFSLAVAVPSLLLFALLIWGRGYKISGGKRCIF
jgi:hypothetical protein